MLRLKQLAESRLRFAGQRVDSDGLSHLVERGLDVSLLLQDRGEHVVRLGVIGPARHRFLEERHRLLRASGLPQHHAERERRFRKRGIEPHRRPQRGRRGLEVVSLFEREAEVVERLGVRRIAPRELAELGDGGVELASLHQRDPEIQARLGKVRCRVHDRAQRLHRRRGIAFLHEREPEAVASVGQRRIQRERLPELRDRAVEIAELLERYAQLGVRRDELRIVPQRDSEAVDGGGQVALLPLGHGEVIARLGVRGPQRDGSLKLRPGAIQLLGPPQRGAQVVVGVEGCGLERDGLFEFRNRLRGVSLEAEHEPQSIVRRSEVRRACQGGTVFRRRRVQILLPFVLAAPQIVRARRPRV